MTFILERRGGMEGKGGRKGGEGGRLKDGWNNEDERESQLESYVHSYAKRCRINGWNLQEGKPKKERSRKRDGRS